MHTELAILRAMLRLSRRQAAANAETLHVRVGGTEAELRNAIRNLETSGFVVRGTNEVKLTMSGLAVAVAQVAPVRARTRRVPAKRRAA